MRYLETFRSRLATRGWRQTLLLAARYPLKRAYRSAASLKEQVRVRRIHTGNRKFDERFGVETSGEASLESLGIFGHDPEQAHGYAAVSQWNFKRVMGAVHVKQEDFIFVDLGSGKGKALLLASDYPFRQIIGVEFSSVLHNIATGNISRYRSSTQRCFQIESVCGDARAFEFPPAPLVVYMYNPFGPDILSKVLDRLETSIAIQPRQCFLIIVYPQAADVVRRRRQFVEIATDNMFAIWRHDARLVSLEAYASFAASAPT